MSHFKTETINTRTETGNHVDKIKISISSDGFFYANLEPELLLAVQGTIGNQFIRKNDKVHISFGDLASLVSVLKRIFENHYTPQKTEEHVILYNIESHVAFAEDENGNIYPSAGFKGASWVTMKNGMYGEHHSSQPSNNGYSLTIGARAKTKITYKYGEREKVEYEDYYKGGSHLGHDNPAQLLNSWTSFSLKNFKEIPYSDESALFFHNLMLSMAKISKMIQEHTFNQENLMRLIASGTNGFLLSNNSKNEVEEIEILDK
ncbi:MAG: hypothetical protein RBR02_10980 [Desulfuromonadaceae bacterium]|nr:hypothetical protein [Desulfuromonadaceae bacterium]